MGREREPEDWGAKELMEQMNTHFKTPAMGSEREQEPELLNPTLERTDRWRVDYAWRHSDEAWFEYIGTWAELMTMMANHLASCDVRKMEIKHYGRTVRQRDHLTTERTDNG